MKKININLNDEDSSYVLMNSEEQDLPLPSTPEIKEIQDNYFIINPENSVSLPEVLIQQPSYSTPNCDVPQPNSQEACISYSAMVKYVTERLNNYIIISATEPQNPVQNQLWIQI
jgi:hypothetical protein